MKPKASLRNFLAIAGSSLLAISYSHGQTLANSYLTTLDVTSPVTLNPAANFPSFMVGSLTGSSTLTIRGLYTQSGGAQGTVSFTNNGAGNTFDGNIIVDSGTLRIAGSPFASNGGFTAPSMTSSNTITINRAGILTIDDNVTGGYTANRFGTSGSRPAVNLSGTINLNGLNNATSSVQTFGALTVSSGVGTINVTRNTAGNPTLTFASLAISKGALLNVNGIGGTLGGAGANDPRITFTSAPTPTSGILPGVRFWDGGNNTGEFATYGANGVRAFTAADYTDYATDISAATSTQNVRITNGVSAAAALATDVTVNSLHYAASGAWNMTNKLTIVSGMLLRGSGVNNALTISSGTLTAGTGSAIDLHMICGIQNINMTTTSVIADNGASGFVTLVKSGDRDMSLSSASNNTYSGGTFVLDGTLTTSSTANTRYLGSGKAVVDGKNISTNSQSNLVLGNVGATSNSTGDDYTAINGGRIAIANVGYTSADTFNIGANSIIAGSSGSGTGLASLTKGTNITLASGAIIGHGVQSGALNLTTGTIQNLGTGADLFYGLNATQNNSGGQITIGSVTAFRGISTDRSDRTWEQGTINIASGTTSVDFQGYAGLANAQQLTLGNGTGNATFPTITSAVSGTVDIRAIGRLQLNDDLAVYGNTGAGQNIRFVATPGSLLTVTPATGMGSGANGIASALVQNGGILAIGNAAALNGAVTVEGGGQFNANQASLTGTGALTFNEGSIVLMSANAAAFSGTQASAATINPGTFFRAAVGSFGSTGTTLDSILGSGSKHVSYITQGNDAANPTASGTAVYTLNKSLLGKGGVLTNDGVSGNVVTNRTITNLTNGHIALGANGGVIAATTNTTLTINENITGAGSLTIGTTAILDGAPKLGAVLLSSTANDYSGTTFVDAGTLQTSNGAVPNGSLVSLANAAGVTFQLNGADTIGNLSGGALSTVTLGTQTLTLGDATNQTFAGTFSGATAGNLVKQGAGVFEMSGTNALTGTTAISNGVLKVSGTSSLSTGNLNLSGGGVLGLANGNFSRAIGTGAGAFQFTGTGGGFAAYGADRTVTPGTLAFGVTAGTNIIGTLVLGAADADSTLIWASSISFGGSQRTVRVNNGSAAVDARLSGALIGGGSSGLDKTGTGTLEITGTGHVYPGATTVTNGTLLVNANISTSSLTTVKTGATLGGSGTVGPLTVEANGTVAPGNSPDVLDVIGAYTQAGNYITEITGNTVGNGTTGYDQINVTGALNTGTVNITGGSLTTLFSGTGYAANDLIFILLNDNTDAIVGTYFGFAQDAVVSTFGGLDWKISYNANHNGGVSSTFNGGNDIALTAIPEPNFAALIGGFGILALLRRRR